MHRRHAASRRLGALAGWAHSPAAPWPPPASPCPSAAIHHSKGTLFVLVLGEPLPKEPILVLLLVRRTGPQRTDPRRWGGGGQAPPGRSHDTRRRAFDKVARLLGLGIPGGPGRDRGGGQSALPRCAFAFPQGASPARTEGLSISLYVSLQWASRPRVLAPATQITGRSGRESQARPGEARYDRRSGPPAC